MQRSPTAKEYAKALGLTSKGMPHLFAHPPKPPPAPVLSSVTIAAKANRDRVEKSYRKMVRAMNSFDAQRGFENDLQSSFKCLGSAPTTLLRATRWSNVANAPPLLTANASR